MTERDITSTITGMLCGGQRQEGEPAGQIADFFKVAANLKNISRQGWIDRLGCKDPESVADHTYMTALMGMVLSDLRMLDTAKVTRMTLLHDIAESVIGDITPDMLEADVKDAMECHAIKKILDLLPEDLAGKYMQVWKEFQDNTTPEARFAHHADRLEMALQARTYSKVLPHGNITPFVDSAKKAITEKEIKEILDAILDR